MAIYSKNRAVDAVKLWKSNGEVVVFTNGCFDLLHRGHVDYLTKAKAIGDRLIVGLNSDKSVFRLKGKGRPIQSAADRAVILEALKAVDGVVIFEEDTPLQLIRELRPDILVKGGDYRPDTVVGANEVIDRGGKVEIIPFLRGYGTTALLARIRKSEKR